MSSVHFAREAEHLGMGFLGLVPEEHFLPSSFCGHLGLAVYQGVPELANTHRYAQETVKSNGA
jgi:hypothetical protein